MNTGIIIGIVLFSLALVYLLFFRKKTDKNLTKTYTQNITDVSRNIISSPINLTDLIGSNESLDKYNIKIIFTSPTKVVSPGRLFVLGKQGNNPSGVAFDVIDRLPSDKPASQTTYEQYLGQNKLFEFNPTIVKADNFPIQINIQSGNESFEGGKVYIILTPK